MLIDTLKTLCSLPGVSSWEDAVRDYIKNEITPYADSIRVDAMGNLIAVKHGEQPGRHSLMPVSEPIRSLSLYFSRTLITSDTLT